MDFENTYRQIANLLNYAKEDERWATRMERGGDFLWARIFAESAACERIDAMLLGQKYMNALAAQQKAVR
jgi:hypothetical protein